MGHPMRHAAFLHVGAAHDTARHHAAAVPFTPARTFLVKPFQKTCLIELINF